METAICFKEYQVIMKHIETFWNYKLNKKIIFPSNINLFYNVRRLQIVKLFRHHLIVLEKTYCLY